MHVMKILVISLQSLKKLLEEMFPGMKFEGSVVQPRRILESEVVLVIPEKTCDKEIVPNRLPTAVSLRLLSISLIIV